MIKRWQAPVKVVQSNPLKDEYCRWVGPRIAFIGPNFEAPIVLIKRISPSVWLSLDSYFIEHQNTNISTMLKPEPQQGLDLKGPCSAAGWGKEEVNFGVEGHDTVMAFPFDWWTSWFCQYVGTAIPLSEQGCCKF